MALGFFALVAQSTTDLVTSYGPVFNSTGLSMFRPIATTLIVWEGFKVAFQNEPANRVASLLVYVAVVYGALTYYSAPIPGVGRNVTQVITDSGTQLADVIDTSVETNVASKVSVIIARVHASSWDIVTDVGNATRYFIIVLVLSAVQVVMLGIVSFGFVAVGVLVMLGPVLLPFAIVPGLDWIANSWLRATIQYAMYPVVANAFIFIYGAVMLNFFDQWGPAVSDPPSIAAVFGQIVVLGMAGVFGILKVPQLVASIFGGYSGLSSFPGYGWWR